VFLVGEKFGVGLAIGAGLGEGFGAIVEIHHAYEIRAKFERMPANTIGGANGSTRKKQRAMLHYWDDPEDKPNP